MQNWSQLKNLKIPDSFDFLGFFLFFLLLILSYTYFYEYEIRIFTKEVVKKISMLCVWKIRDFMCPKPKNTYIRMSYILLLAVSADLCKLYLQATIFTCKLYLQVNYMCNVERRRQLTTINYKIYSIHLNQYFCFILLCKIYLN